MMLIDHFQPCVSPYSDCSITMFSVSYYCQHFHQSYCPPAQYSSLTINLLFREEQLKKQEVARDAKRRRGDQVRTAIREEELKEQLKIIKDEIVRHVITMFQLLVNSFM